MANTIKLKTGSGSDPSASDLVVGELAIRTDSGKIFTKKDNGSVAEISGGGGIEDGDKGDITVSNGGDTFTIDNNAITTAKIADVQVTTSKLVVNAVTENRITDGAVTSAKIADGTIVNADINASAAIAGSKISPNFGSQNISTTGTLGSGNITISSTAPKIIFTDSNNNPDYQLINEGGTFLLYDSTNGVDKVKVQADGHIDITPNTDFANGIDVTGNVEITSGDVLIYDQHPSIRFTDSDAPSGYGHVGVNNTSGSLVLRSDDGNALSGTFMGFEIDGSPKMRLDNTGLGIGTNSPSQKLDVVGNIAVSGTVDGVDIAARNTLFGGLTSSSGVLTNGVTATTQGASDNTTKVATTAYVTTAISNLINGAPSALDTLNELAAAMNDDAAFSTTVTNSLATKMPLAGGEFTGNVTFSGSQTVDGRDLSVDGAKLDGIESGATADQTASEILTLIKTVDGAGSGLDADTLDGVSSASFCRSDAADTCSGKITFSDGIVLPTTGDGIKFGAGDAANDDAHIEWLGSSNGGYLRISTSDDSDSGSPEYIEFGDYATQNKVGTFTQHLRISRERFLVRTGSNSISQADRLNIDSSGTVDIYGNLDVGAGIDVTGLATVTRTTNSETQSILELKHGNGTQGIGFGYNTISAIGSNSNINLKLASKGSGEIYLIDNVNAQAGIDVTGNITVTGTVDGRDVASDGSKLDGIESGATADQSNSEIKTAYEANSNTNAFTDALLSKLNGIAASATNVTNNNQLTNGAGYITATLTNEQVQDIVGGMVSGNTESGITVTYQDGDGTLDFSVASQTDNNFTNADHSKLDGIEANATADQTASEILTLLKTVDGAGSGLDSDLLDGQSSAFYRSAGNINAGTLAAARLPTQEAGISIVGNFGQWESHGTYTNFNTEPAYWGWNFVMGNTNAPNTTSSQWYRCRLSLGSNYGKGSDGGDYSLEMALPRSSHSAAGVLHIRAIENGVESSWTTVGDNASLITTGTLPAARLPNHSAALLTSGTLPAGRLPNHSASLLTSGTIPAARVPTLNQNTTGSAATLTTARTIAGVSFDGSANISLNNNAITNGAGYITSADGGNAATLDSIDSSQFLRSDTADTASGDISFQGGAGAATIAANSDIRFTNGSWTGNSTKIQHHDNYLYIAGGSNGIIFREDGTNRWIIDGSGHLDPATDSTYDIGASGTRVRNGYFDTLYGDGSNLTGISAGATGGGSDEVFYENDQTVTTNYTITNGKNAMAAGPITINSGVTVTVGSGETLTIV